MISESGIWQEKKKEDTRIQRKQRIRGPTTLQGESAETESKAVDAATTGPARTITKNGVDYEIPKKLYNRYKVLRAQLYSQYANEIIKTPEYQKLSNEKKALKLKSLQSKATNEARKRLNIEEELNIP